MTRGELFKSVRRVRTWVALASLAALPIIATIATAVSPEPQEGIERTLYAVSTASGVNNALASLAFMSPFFLVIVVALFAGDAVAGEASWGTLRSLLTRPVGRGRLLWRKLASVWVMTAVAAVTIAGTGLIAGTIAFGWHGVHAPVIGEVFSAGEGAARLALATAYVVASMGFVVSFAFMISTMTDAPYGAIGAAVGLAIASQILDGISALRDIRFGLPTHYWSAWVSLFAPITARAEMVRGIALQGAYSVLFLSVAFWWFRRKDVLS